MKDLYREKQIKYSMRCLGKVILYCYQVIQYYPGMLFQNLDLKLIMIDRLKNEVYNLSMDCSKLIVQKDELLERNQILKQELEETAEISGLGDALLDEAKSLIDKLESDNNGLNDEVKAQQLYIESLENDKRTLLDDYEYISLDNLTLQSEIISLKRNLEEHDNKVANLFAELNSILKKNK